MSLDAIILDSRSIIYVRADKSQNLFHTTRKKSFLFEDKRLYTRTGNDIVFEEEVLKSSIRQLTTENRQLKELSVILPHSVSWYSLLDVEELPKGVNEARDFVMWKIQKSLPIPKEQAELRVQSLFKDKEGEKVLVVVTFKNIVNAISRVLEREQLVVPVITTPTLAFMNFFHSKLPQNGIVVWIRERDYSMVCINDGMPLFVREVDNPVNLRRITSEIFSFVSFVNENQTDFRAEEIVYFDEIEREGINDFFPENALSLEYKKQFAESSGDSPASYISLFGLME